MTLAEIHTQCEPDGDCLVWTGLVRDGTPRMRVYNPKTGKYPDLSLRRIVWRDACEGAAPAMISTTCGNALCLLPEHLTRFVSKRRERKTRAKAEVMRELLEPPGHRGRAFHHGPLIVDQPPRGTKARIGTESVANYGGIVPPNSPESFAICDAVRQEIVGKDKPGMARPWLIGRSV